VVDLVEVELTIEGRLARLGFLGGCILPGIGLTRDALSQATGALAAHMPESAVGFRIQGLPRNARDAIAYGLAAAQSSALLTIPPPVGVIVHGGYAKDWLRYFQAVRASAASHLWDEPAPFFFEAPHLVLDGVEQWASAMR
jgi:pantothenate kinase type III